MPGGAFASYGAILDSQKRDAKFQVSLVYQIP